MDGHPEILKTLVYKKGRSCYEPYTELCRCKISDESECVCCLFYLIIEHVYQQQLGSL